MALILVYLMEAPRARLPGLEAPNIGRVQHAVAVGRKFSLAPVKSHDGLPGEVTMLKYDVLPRSRIGSVRSVGVGVSIRVLSGVESPPP
jgi:hypothetical protein